MDKKAAERAVHLSAAYKKTFENPEGEEVLVDLMQTFGFFSTTYMVGDSHASAFAEGARAAVLRIVDTVGVEPVKFLDMMKEVNQEVFDEE